MIAHTKAQADHKTACNATQDRKSENKKGRKTRRILTLQYEQKNRATGTNRNKRNSRMASQDRCQVKNS